MDTQRGALQWEGQLFFEETQLSSTVRVFLAIVMLVGTGAQAKGKGVSHSVSKTTAPRKGAARAEVMLSEGR